MSTRCLYVDLDGTLLGRGASLLHDGEGRVSIDGVRAVQACMRADVEVVLMSGRRRAQVHEDARLLGQDSFIFEAGACVVLRRRGALADGRAGPGRAEHCRADRALGCAGAAAGSVCRAAGVSRAVARRTRSLAPVPRSGGRRRGRSVAGRARLRASAAHRQRRRQPPFAGAGGAASTCAAITSCRRGASKAAAVALHQRARGYAREETFAVGDSREDMACARHVGHVLAGRERAGARPVDPRGDGGVRERARVRGRRTGRESMRRSCSRRLMTSR